MEQVRQLLTPVGVMHAEVESTQSPAVEQDVHFVGFSLQVLQELSQITSHLFDTNKYPSTQLMQTLEVLQTAQFVIVFATQVFA